MTLHMLDRHRVTESLIELYCNKQSNLVEIFLHHAAEAGVSTRAVDA